MSDFDNLDHFEHAFSDTLLEENSTEFAEGLYLAGRVSEATGATIMFAGHTGKLDLSEVKPADGRVLPRGTSAIVAACGAAFTISGGKGAPKLVKQIKGRILGGPVVEDFYLALESVQIPGYCDPANPGDPGGFRVRYLPAEAVKPPKSPEADLAEVEERIVELLQKRPGASTRQIRVGVKRDNNVVGAAIDGLTLRGKVRREEGGKGRPTKHYLADDGDHP
ncbi:MAG: hypothetical protein HY744_04215 [Deltaproteobacteria bacterium]|nr:hypothetical protein [Deltaproteobacteria bacterium]